MQPRPENLLYNLKENQQHKLFYDSLLEYSMKLFSWKISTKRTGNLSCLL